MDPKQDSFLYTPQPSSLEDDEHRYRTARVQSALMVVALGMLAFVLFDAVVERPRPQLVIGVLCIGVVAARAWARRPPAGRFESLPLHLAIGFASAAVVANSLFVGGSQTYIQYYLVLVPAFAACLLSVRDTFLWTLAAIVGFAFIRFGQENFGIAPEPFLHEWEVAFGQTVLALMVFGAALSQWTTTAKHVEGIHAREAMIREQARELAVARDTALRASAVKDQFLAIVSHEIRTPMNAVIGLTDVVLETKLDDEQRPLLETVRSSSEVLLGILNDILDFSKIESDRIELEHRVFSVRDCIEDSLELLASRAAERGVELLYDHPREVPSWILGDPTRLRQIVMNLVSNAVKFTQDGDVVVRVRSGAPAEGTPALRIAVCDTGIGIPPERQDRLFQPFSQVDASTTRRFGGTGLGLAITKRLVERMGGTVTVESEPGRGSEFAVTVPAEDATDRAGSARFDVSILRGRRLLTVLHHPLQRELLERDARDHEMTIRSASSLDEARGWLVAGEEFDAVFIDSRTFGTNAAEILDEMKRRARVPFILLAAPGSRSEGIAAEEAACFTLRIGRPLRTKRFAVSLAAVWGRTARSEPGGAEVRTVESVSDLDGLRVLVAEDNLVNQRVARIMLGKLGCEADVVSDGAQAVEAFRQRHYDLVLMDVQMPEMDGLEATRAIRALGPPGEQARIIALTANAMGDDRLRCLEAGMDDFVSKPLSVLALSKVIERSTARGRS